MNKMTFTFSVVTALALGVVGCGDSSSNNGTGGTGGSGDGASVTAAHFAPEVPSADNTAVAIFIDGAEVEALGTLEYGQSTGRVPLDAGTYDIGIGLPGGDAPLLQLDDVPLEDGDDLTVIAYRTNADLPVDVFVVGNATDGLEDGKGRVLVAHGANDSLLNPVDIILTDEGACPPPLLDQLEFEQVKPDGGLDLDEATYNLGFDLNPGDCAAEVSFSAPVTPGVTTIVVAVDEDTTDESLSPQVWAIINASDAPVALIEQ
jgi:hypothetical protein